MELDGQGKFRAPGDRRRRKNHPQAQVLCSSNAETGATECEAVWQIRREFSYALRDTGLTKLNEDIVVPRGRLEDFAPVRRKIAKEASPPTRLLQPRWRRQHPHERDGGLQPARCEIAFREMPGRIVPLGDRERQGPSPASTGNGLAKKRWWPQAVSENSRELHRVVKRALDPHGILNPGKFV